MRRGLPDLVRDELAGILQKKVDLVSDGGLSMRGKLGDKIRLQHILDSIGEIENYRSGVTIEQFTHDSEKSLATITN